MSWICVLEGVSIFLSSLYICYFGIYLIIILNTSKPTAYIWLKKSLCTPLVCSVLGAGYSVQLLGGPAPDVNGCILSTRRKLLYWMIAFYGEYNLIRYPGGLWIIIYVFVLRCEYFIFFGIAGVMQTEMIQFTFWKDLIPFSKLIWISKFSKPTIIPFQVPLGLL